MKKLKHTLVKTHTKFCELILKPSRVLETSVIDDQKFIEDIRLKSYAFRKIGF